MSTYSVPSEVLKDTSNIQEDIGNYMQCVGNMSIVGM